MEKIAAPLVLRVNLGPLPYMDPEKYLACLAAAFQIRSSKSILARAGRLRATRAVHQSGYQPPELSSIFTEPVG